MKGPFRGRVRAIPDKVLDETLKNHQQVLQSVAGWAPHIAERLQKAARLARHAFWLSLVGIALALVALTLEVLK